MARVLNGNGMTNLTEKQALQDWEKYRQNVRRSTPVDMSLTSEQKKKKKDELEADPQKWKEYFFPKYFKYPSPEFHLKASKRLLKNFKQKRHWYEVRHWARGLSKSTTLMFDVLYLVLTGQLKNIILTSSTYDAAEKFLMKYMMQLDSNERIKYFYGIQELPGSWSAGNFTTRGGAMFIACGARQTPRGNGNEEIRPDCLIIDDFDTDEECRNDDIIKQKWDWFEKALFFTVDTAEPYLVAWLGNIIAPDCCVVRAGHVADYCEIINIRDENGVSVWPQKNKEEDIDYQIGKVSYEASQQEMFNNPIRQGATFKEMTYGKCPPVKDLPFVVLYGDPSPSNRDKPSAKSKAQNSCKAVPAMGYYKGKYYIYKVFLDVTTNATFIGWLYELYAWAIKNGAKLVYVLVENNTLQDPFYQQVLLPLVHEFGKTGGFVLPITPDTRTKPEKFFRIEGKLEPLNRMGNLILNIDEKDNPHMKRLEAQFKSVSPTSKTMDGPDAVEGGATIIEMKISAVNTSWHFGNNPVNTKRF